MYIRTTSYGSQYIEISYSHQDPDIPYVLRNYITRHALGSFVGSKEVIEVSDISGESDNNIRDQI